MHKSHDAMTG
jgi:hypothetical protein